MAQASFSKRAVWQRPLCTLAGSVLLSASLASSANAHSGTGLPGGLLAGALHPITGPDHMLAMVGVGIWGAFLGRPMVALLPVVFPAFMALGGSLAILGVPFVPVEWGVALSVVLLGGMIAGAVRAPAWASIPIIALFGLCHGYAHGSELPSAADPAGYSLGFIVATGCLHVAGIALGLLRERRGGDAILRLAGAVGVLAGLVFLSRAAGA